MALSKAKSFFKYLLLLLFIAVLFKTGMVREDMFTAINNALYYCEQGAAAGFFETSCVLLYASKWILTVVFALMYLVSACAAVWFIFRQKAYVKITLLVYLAFFAFAFFVMASGYALSHYNAFYAFSRKIMGVAQSPVLIVVLIPVFHLIQRESY